MFEQFYNAMALYLTPEARILTSQFRGDPYSDVKGKWRARVLNNPGMVDDMANVYLCVSAMKRNQRGEFRRRKENFAGGILLMIDDIGTGAGAKFPMSVIDPLPPTAMVETSPDNYQAFYFFDQLVTDIKKFDALINAFINRQFLGEDTGQAGVNRVFRPPAGINGKTKYLDAEGRPWRVRMTDWHPERRYSVERIAEAFDLTLVRENRIRRDPGIMTATKAERIKHFVSVRSTLRSAGMMKDDEPDMSGWMQIRCPWTDGHTGGVDNGAAIKMPDEENNWTGAFRCHHGSCKGRLWRQLTDWIAEEQYDLLDMVNYNAPATPSRSLLKGIKSSEENDDRR